MSAEYNMSRNSVRSSDAMQSFNVSCTNDDNLEDAAGSANNSIIGKVKSRVSSIIPTSLSKWFSPSARISNDTSINGSFNTGCTRRRRRIEIEDEDDDYGDDSNIVDHNTRREFKENSIRHHSLTKDTDEEGSDNNSEDELPIVSPVSGQRAHRNLKSSGFIQQPPNKRSRISLDVTTTQENPLMRHEPLVASTPAMGHSVGSGTSHMPVFLSVVTPHLTHSTNIKYREEHTSPLTHNNFDSQQKRNTNVLISQPKINEQLQNVDKSPPISSRRTLHLPSTSQAATEGYNMSRFSNINHQSHVDDPSARAVATSAFMVETNLADKSKLNGRTPSYVTNKRQKLINGTEEIGGTVESNEGDSGSESSEGCSGNGNITIEEVANSSVAQKKTGLFNMSSANCRNVSRTSSFGNGMNFYSHLEGRKSLFSSTAQGGMSGGALNALNNSTLSLTSLNRRQFNASIYGSTSALSDSRLLNTFSPFYKGKTTYGGAAAYKKYGPGVGSSAGMTRITPTLIRPTSSLSTLSSSNNSLAATGGHSIGPNGSAEPSAISSTAKRILDLINDFATPLSEAKKMANNIKTNQQQLLPQTKARLNDTDLQTSRAMRLSQVRTPYMRPAVTLHPTKGRPLPPVRELQVPSMSQLLQMKKMQSTTERSRQITMQSTSNVTCPNVSKGYKLPVSVESAADGNELQSQQQKHTNKIKNKRSCTRITASKDVTDLVDDETSPVNLPDIAFPLMQSVPKFDIALPVSSVATAKANKVELRNENATTEKSLNATNTISLSLRSTDYKKDLQKPTEITVSALPLDTINNFNFKFSVPLEVKTTNSPLNNVMIKSYKFSPPAAVNSNTFKHELSPVTLKQHSTDVPKLKSGSVLDVLKKPLTMPNSNVKANDNTSKSLVNESNTFGAQFKKSSGKWECNTCLVRNEEVVSTCVACETPRTMAGTSAPPSISTMSAPSSFGSQFKKSVDEWECDTCMIRNKEQSSKCVACETPRKSVTSGPKGIGSQSITTINSFGDAFKPKANTWECPTCLINNKSEYYECVACQTKKPGSNTPIGAVAGLTAGTNFKFGFNQPITPAKNIEDDGFKSIAAAQKASKWECEACMTRNDAERLKCVCCEQAKPGTQNVSESTPKFSFGSTAATKYTFGFGNNVNTSKERQPESNTTKETTELKADTKSKGFIFGSSSSATPASTGFTFGIKPATSTTLSNSIKDTTDKSTISKASETSQSVVGFKFGDNTSVNTSTSASNANLSFGSSKSSAVNTIAAAVSTTITTTSVAIQSVKISLSPSTDITESSTKTDKTKGLCFGNTGIVPPSSQPSLQTSGGFSFGAPIKATADQNKKDEKTAVASFNFKTPTAVTPATTNNNMKTFSFGTQPISAPQSANLASTTTTTTVGLKPAFSFGNSTLSATPISSTANTITNTNSTPTLTTGGFSFGTSSSLSSSAPKPTVGASVTSINTTMAPNASLSNTFSTGKAALNVFGSVGNPTITSAATTSTTLSANIAKTTVPSASNSGNAFGSLSQGSQLESKLTAPATVIFGSNSGTTGGTSGNIGTVTTTPFAFGSPLSTIATANSTATSSVSSTSWPKSSFVFGSTGSNNAVSNANEAPNQPVFGSFGSMHNTATQLGGSTPAPSIFGNPTTTAPSAATPTFGSTSATASANATNIFGSNATTSAPTTNMFGNANAPASTFGTTPVFGSSNNNGNPTPTFGSTAGTNPAFGSFGPATNTATASDGVSAAKKPELAFNFGATNAQSTSGGFNFGANTGAASKPAFNFAATSAPTFNFTGSNEGTPNAPFQFSAGGASASSNIFAPTPTSGTQTTLQARRKIRQPTRRLTPR